MSVLPKAMKTAVAAHHDRKEVTMSRTFTITEEQAQQLKELLVSLGDYTGNVDKRTGIDRCELVGFLSGILALGQASEPKPRVLQISTFAAATDDEYAGIVALREDGTIWSANVLPNTHLAGTGWTQLPYPEAQEEEENEPELTDPGVFNWTVGINSCLASGSGSLNDAIDFARQYGVSVQLHDSNQKAVGWVHPDGSHHT